MNAPARPPRLSPRSAGGATLLDLLDHVLDQGVALDGKVMLGMAGVDLAYLRLSALLCAADRIPGRPGAVSRSRAAPLPPAGEPLASLASAAAADLPRGPASTQPQPRARPGKSSTLQRRADPLPRAARKQPGPKRAEEVERSVVKLVLTLVELVRSLFERQAIRRLEEETLTAQQAEALGRGLQDLEQAVRSLARRFRIPMDELGLDLGPIGRVF